MPNVTNTLIANISTTEDTTQNVIINRTVPGLVFDSTVAQGVIYQSLTGAFTVNLPSANCYQLYVRNNDPTNNVNVNANAGSINWALHPGSAIFLWQSPTNGTAITSLQLTPAGTPCLVEYFIGA